MSKVDLDRRALCQAACAAAAVGVLPACGGDPNASLKCGTGKVKVDNVAGIAVGQLKPIERLGYDTLFICRDADGLYALNAQCTHFKCTLVFMGQTTGFKCDCHTATFDFNGQNPTMPATMPLEHYAMCSDGAGGVVV